MRDFIQGLFLFIAGHSLADTALQPPSMGAGKNRNREIDMSRVPPGQKPMNLWYMWLTHHALIQGLVVFFIAFVITFDCTLSAWLAMIETCSHWIIDYYKCANKYSPIEDQLFHIVMKVIYTIVLITR